MQLYTPAPLLTEKFLKEFMITRHGDKRVLVNECSYWMAPNRKPVFPICWPLFLRICRPFTHPWFYYIIARLLEAASRIARLRDHHDGIT